MNFIQIFEELILDKIRIKLCRDKIRIKRHGLLRSMKQGERVMRLNLLVENLSKTQITFTLFAKEALIYAIHKIHFEGIEIPFLNKMVQASICHLNYLVNLQLALVSI